MMGKLFSKSGAVFSDCRKYRYALWRIWDGNKSLAMIIGLNQSTADETLNDPSKRSLYDRGINNFDEVINPEDIFDMFARS